MDQRLTHIGSDGSNIPLYARLVKKSNCDTLHLRIHYADASRHQVTGYKNVQDWLADFAKTPGEAEKDHKDRIRKILTDRQSIEIGMYNDEKRNASLSSDEEPISQVKRRKTAGMDYIVDPWAILPGTNSAQEVSTSVGPERSRATTAPKETVSQLHTQPSEPTQPRRIFPSLISLVQQKASGGTEEGTGQVLPRVNPSEILPQTTMHAGSAVGGLEAQFKKWAEDALPTTTLRPTAVQEMIEQLERGLEEAQRKQNELNRKIKRIHGFKITINFSKALDKLFQELADLAGVQQSDAESTIESAQGADIGTGTGVDPLLAPLDFDAEDLRRMKNLVDFPQTIEEAQRLQHRLSIYDKDVTAALEHAETTLRAIVGSPAVNRLHKQVQDVHQIHETRRSEVELRHQTEMRRVEEIGQHMGSFVKLISDAGIFAETEESSARGLGVTAK